MRIRKRIRKKRRTSKIAVIEIDKEKLLGLYPDFKGGKAFIVSSDELLSIRERSALSGLPGNTEIKNEIEKNFISSSGDTLVVYFDINGFKAYNDNYGFIKGDVVIKNLADEFSRIAPCFAGHIGGDDFVALVPEKVFDGFIKTLLTFFEKKIKEYYDSVDYERGCIITFDREGHRQRQPLMGITAVAFANSGSFRTSSGVGEFAAQLKKIAKLKAKKYIGNSIVFKYDGTSVTPLADLIMNEKVPLKIRRSVVEALGELKDFSYENILMNILQSSSDLFLLKSALYALGRLRMKATSNVIEKFLKHPSAHLRMRAVEALGELGEARSGDEISALLKDKDYFVKRAAVLALGKIADKRYTTVLREKLEDRSVRDEAYLSLAMMGDTDIIAGLPIFINDKSVDVELRSKAAEILGETADFPTAELILRGIADKDPVLIVSCLKAVSAVLRRTSPTGENPIDKKVFSLVSHGYWQVRRALAELCGEWRADKSPEALVKLSRDPSINVRVRAVESLAKYPASAELVCGFFSSSSPAVKSAAASSVKFINIPEENISAVVEKLRIMLKDPSHDVAANAAKSIIYILRHVKNAS